MSARNCKRLLHECLKELRLPTMRTGFAEVAEQARAESLSYEQFLLELAERERDVRGHKRIERALRASRLPLEKTLKSFDRKRLPPKVDAHINVLLEGTFLDRCENVLASENPAAVKRTCCVPSARNSSTNTTASSTDRATCSYKSCWRPSAIWSCPARSNNWPVTICSSSTTSVMSSTVERRWRSSSTCWRTATNGAVS